MRLSRRDPVRALLAAVVAAGEQRLRGGRLRLDDLPRGPQHAGIQVQQPGLRGSPLFGGPGHLCGARARVRRRSGHQNRGAFSFCTLLITFILCSVSWLMPTKPRSFM